MCSGEDRASKKSNYNSAIQRWFKKKQLPLWTHCVRHWQEETREAQLPDIVALAFRNWQADYAFATRRMARREQRGTLFFLSRPRTLTPPRPLWLCSEAR